MILHYIQISLRNLRKYKTQTAISICAMAVSLTLLGMCASMILTIKPTPLFDQPYAKRVEQIRTKDNSQYINHEDFELIANHQFKNAEKIHFTEGTTYFMKITSDSGSDNELSMYSVGTSTDTDFMNFMGIRSTISGKKASPISDNEVIITDWLAKRLFKGKNPIGKYINLDFTTYNGSNVNRNFVIKDVIETLHFSNEIIPTRCQIFIPTDHLSKDSRVSCLFVLREGASRDSLAKELNEIFTDDDKQLLNVWQQYSEKEKKIMTDQFWMILFLFLFVVVSFSNYMRQQLQLFRLREREVALRTCVGGGFKSLFILFLTEIMIVLSLTFLLTIALIYTVSDFFITHYSTIFEQIKVDFSDAVPIASVTIVILIFLSIVAVTFTIWRIRRDQTGLALRMKPLPKHHLRNVGLTLQICVSILFISVSILLFMAGKGLKEFHGIPDEIDRYKRCLSVRLSGISMEERHEIYQRIESLESVEKVYKYYNFMTTLDPDSYDNSSVFTLYYQTGKDVVDYFDLKIKKLPGEVNPDRNILISEDFKKMLEDKNLWNGKTVRLPDNNGGEYEVKGVYDKIPFSTAQSRESVIITDASRSDSYYDRIILPKAGRENETKNAIEGIFKDVCPSRIDLTIENSFNDLAPDYNLTTTMMYVIYILSVISVITTLAGIYAGIALDTRRRRKEMALRKLNGASHKVIAMIFVRSYIWIFFVAILITLSLYIIVSDWMPYRKFLSVADLSIAYASALLIIIISIYFTISGKIRDIMHADPIDYLKE